MGDKGSKRRNVRFGFSVALSCSHMQKNRTCEIVLLGKLSKSS